MIGETILHYVILENLGQSGMEVVYQALNKIYNRTIILKLLPHYLTNGPYKIVVFIISGTFA